MAAHQVLNMKVKQARSEIFLSDPHIFGATNSPMQSIPLMGRLREHGPIQIPLIQEI